MALSAFDDPKARPTNRALERVLGDTYPAWLEMKQGILDGCAPLREEWAFAGAKFGWSLRLKRGTRVIVYMTPCPGHFLASFALGEKACAAARDAGLRAGVLKLIARAPKYAEGRGVRIPVRSGEDVPAIVALAAIKLAN